MFANDWKALELSELPAKQQARISRNVKRGDVTSVYPMIVKLGTESWSKLPPHTRQWYTKEEYIAAGTAFAVTAASKEFDSKRTNRETGEAVKFSSFLYERLLQFYITAESEPLRAAKRWEGGTYSFDSSKIPIVLGGINKAVSAEFYITLTTKVESPAEEIIQRVDAKKGFLLVYDAATPNLRKYLIKWFLSSKVIRMREGQDYRAAKKELAKLAPKIGFSCQMAIFLAHNDLARAECALEIIRTYRTHVRTGYGTTLRNSMEKEAISTAVMAGA